MNQSNLDEVVVKDIKERTNDILNKITYSNNLYTQFVGEIENSQNSSLILEAGTGEGKTRCALYVGIKSFLENVDNEYFNKNTKKHKITIIAVPYVIIAEQFFLKLSQIRLINKRPLIAKLLTSSNTNGNTLTAFWKASAQEIYSKMEYSVGDKTKAKPNNMWDVELYGGIKKIVSDVIVGSYEMIFILLDKLLNNASLMSALEINVVIDEIQEVLVPSARQFNLFNLFFRVLTKKYPLLLMSGTPHISNIITELPIIKDLIKDTPTLTYTSFHKFITSTSKCNISINQLLTTMIFKSKNLDPKQFTIMDIMSLCIGYDTSKNTYTFTQEFNVEGRNIILGRLNEIITYILNNIPWVVVAANNIVFRTLGNPCGMIIYINSKKHSKPIMFTIASVAMAIAVLNNKLINVDYDMDNTLAVNKQTNKYYDVSERVRKIKVDERKYYVSDDEGLQSLKNEYNLNLSFAKLSNYNPGVVRTMMKRLTKRDRISNNWEYFSVILNTPSFTKNGESLTDIPKRIITNTENGILSVMMNMGLWMSNADIDMEDTAEREFVRYSHPPSVIIATQKIAVGADIPNIHYVAVVSAGDKYIKVSKQMMDQVIGRVDRSRKFRWVYAEEGIIKNEELPSSINSNVIIKFISNLISNTEFGQAAIDVLKNLVASDDTLLNYIIDVVYYNFITHPNTNTNPYLKQSISTYLTQTSINNPVGGKIEVTNETFALSSTYDKYLSTSINNIINNTEIFNKILRYKDILLMVNHILPSSTNLNIIFPLGFDNKIKYFSTPITLGKPLSKYNELLNKSLTTIIQNPTMIDNYEVDDYITTTVDIKRFEDVSHIGVLDFSDTVKIDNIRITYRDVDDTHMSVRLNINHSDASLFSKLAFLIESDNGNDEVRFQTKNDKILFTNPLKIGAILNTKTPPKLITTNKIFLLISLIYSFIISNSIDFLHSEIYSELQFITPQSITTQLSDLNNKFIGIFTEDLNLIDSDIFTCIDALTGPTSIQHTLITARSGSRQYDKVLDTTTPITQPQTPLSKSTLLMMKTTAINITYNMLSTPVRELLRNANSDLRAKSLEKLMYDSINLIKSLSTLYNSNMEYNKVFKELPESTNSFILNFMYQSSTIISPIFNKIDNMDMSKFEEDINLHYRASHSADIEKNKIRSHSLIFMREFMNPSEDSYDILSKFIKK